MAQFGNGGTPKFNLNGLSEVGSGVGGGLLGEDSSPKLMGMPLKYISLVTLAVQNASLTIIMHYSRVSTPASRTYSAASAVLLNELLKGFISLVIAYSRVDDHGVRTQPPIRRGIHHTHTSRSVFLQNPKVMLARCKRLGKEVFSPDCWKLSIPAILYVVQNNLQFVAASNLEAATFQVSYQMKILTTAAFSVAMLGKRLSPTKWLALVALAIGVGIVQIQAGSSKSRSGNDHHEMHPMKGFMAVVAACFTSGLAGVYFEMVLKNSQADLWIRNVQLSLFSLLPALVPILASPKTSSGAGWFWELFAHFGVWAWATVATQVLGGLITAVVIKYSDNIMKGFATSLSIVLSFLASIALFGFNITPSFVVGSSTVLAATWLYNQPDAQVPMSFPKIVQDAMESSRRSFSLSRKSSFEHVDSGAPILGQCDQDLKRSSFGNASPRALAAALRLTLSTPRTSEEHLNGNGFAGHNDTLPHSRNVSGQSTPPYGYQTPHLLPSPRYSPTTTTPPVSFPPSRMPSSVHLSQTLGLGVPGVPTSLSLSNDVQAQYLGERLGPVVRLDETPSR